MQNSCFHTNVSGFIITPIPYCLKGLYCPRLNVLNPDTNPQLCIPSQACELNKLRGKSCLDLDENGYYGAQGLYEPVLCPPGYYCPNPLQIYKCPEGSFCPTGSIVPKPCNWLSSCPEGTMIRQSLSMIWICLIIDGFIFLSWLWKKNSEEKAVCSKQGEDNSISANHHETIFRRLKDLVGEDSISAVTFHVENLCCSISSGKMIIDHLTVTLKAGAMTCILGPSGSGKTTFLNALSGRLTSYTGNILLNGNELDLSRMKRLFGYVPQDDSLPKELSPLELIIHSGRMRLKNVKNEDIADAADAIINLLNLNLVKTTLFQELSGGEKKRVSIGMELIAFPSILFLDEPTTGLDSSSALEIVNILEMLKNLGTTIIAVLHSPRIEIFRKFDNVIMFADCGKILYDGLTGECKRYFENQGFVFMDGSNEADIFSDIVNGTAKLNSGSDYEIRNLHEKWILQVIENPIPLQGCPFPEDDLNHLRQSIHSRGAPFLTQTWYSYCLFWKQQYRKVVEFALECASSAFIGWFYGVVMSRIPEPYVGAIKHPFTLLSPAPNLNEFVQMAFILCLTTSFAATPSGVKLFSDEIPFILRNKSVGNSSLAYFLGKSFAAFPRIALASFHYSAFAFYSARPVYSFNTLYSVIFLIYFNIYGVCSFVSMVISPSNSTLFSVVIVIFLGGLSGYGPTFKEAIKWNLAWLWQVSYNFYAVEAIFTETLLVYDHIYDKNVANFIYSFNVNRTTFDLIAMFTIGCIWRVLAFIGLLKKQKRK